MRERPHHRLIVWQQSVSLIRMVYDLMKSMPVEERYNLVSQMKRCSVSVASNIAEGAARFSNAEKINFFRIARGSLSELETQIEICEQLNLLRAEQTTTAQ